MNIRVAGFEKESVVDGPGIRYVIFTQGCPHGCPGCHNPATHDFFGGILMDTEEILKDIEKHSYLSGVTFSGGDPFVQPEPVLEMAKLVKERGLSVVLYSGFTYEQLLELGEKNSMIFQLLQVGDLLVDGKFRLEEKDLSLAFRGSLNQRLVDLQRSRIEEKTILWQMESEKALHWLNKK